MSVIERIASIGLVTVLLGSAALANESAKVVWHSDVQNAWQQTQQQGRPMLVFVTRADCYYCTQMKDHTLADLNVNGAIRGSFVPLVLDGGGNSQLLKELKVTAYPCTFIISPQAVIVDRIDGFVTAEVLSSRLTALQPKMPVIRLAKDP